MMRGFSFYFKILWILFLVCTFIGFFVLFLIRNDGDNDLNSEKSLFARVSENDWTSIEKQLFVPKKAKKQQVKYDTENTEVNGSNQGKQHIAVQKDKQNIDNNIPKGKLEGPKADLHNQNPDVNKGNEEMPEYSADKYPMNVDMAKILQQFTEKGYADLMPINSFDYGYVINPIHTCSGNQEIKVLFVVKTSPDHLLRRAAIRETWGSAERFPTIRTVFSFGMPKDVKWLLKLQSEASESKDILLTNFVDDYYNLTLKTLSGINWAVDHCSRAKYMVSVDDDIYTAPDLLLHYLDHIPLNMAHKLFSGHLLINTIPVRNKSSEFAKWRVLQSEYPFRNYPYYIFGGYVIMSMTTVREFRIAARYTKILKFEDVYLGILASKLGINATNNGYVNSRKTSSVTETFKTLIASHFYGDSKELRRAWECHLSVLDKKVEKLAFCEFIGKRLQGLKTEIDSIIKWMNAVREQYSYA